MRDEQYADFILYYRERSDEGDSYPHLWQLNKEYLHEDARLVNQSGMGLQENTLKMDNIGKGKTFDATNARLSLQEEYKGKADKIARDYGFTGLSYDEHQKREEREPQKGQTQNVKPDNGKDPPKSPSGGAKATPKTPSKEEQRQAFMQQMREAGSGLTKGKERDR